MALYTATAEVQALVAAGMTVQDINVKLTGFRFSPIEADGHGGYTVNSRNYQSRLAALVAQTAPVTTADSQAQSVPMITDSQMAYIMRLIGRGAHEEGGYMSGPTTYDAISKLTRKQASAYIDSLTGRY